MIMAYTCALRSTCRRRAVGAVILDENKCIIGTGYNGVPSGTVHCIDQACPGAGYKSGDGLDMCHAIHAEQNAIAHCDISRAHTIFTTTLPCMSCMKALIATPIRRIVYCDTYPHNEVEDYWQSTGREIMAYEPTTAICAGLRMEAALRATRFKQTEDTGDRHGDERPKPH